MQDTYSCSVQRLWCKHLKCKRYTLLFQVALSALGISHIVGLELSWTRWYYYAILVKVIESLSEDVQHCGNAILLDLIYFSY